MKKSEEILKNQTNFSLVFSKLWRNKWIIFITILFFLGMAYIFNNIYSPVYKNHIKILVKDNNVGEFLTSDNVLPGYAGLKKKNNLENELEILNSYYLVKKTVDQMNSEVSYFSEKKIFPWEKPGLTKKFEVYDQQPIVVSINKAHAQPIYMEMYIKFLTDSTFKIEAFGEEVPLYNYIDNAVVDHAPQIYINDVYSYGEEIKNDHYNFTVSKGEDFNLLDSYKGRPFFFQFNNIEYVAQEYLSNLNVLPTSPTSTTVIVSMKGNSPGKMVDFFNQYSAVYFNMNLEKKNKESKSIVHFIDSQINNVSDSLLNTESTLKNFRSSNSIMDLSFQSQKMVENINDLQGKRSDLSVQLKYYRYINDYIKNNQDVLKILSPSSMNVVDPLMTQLVEKLVTLTLERKNLIKEGNSKNLYLSSLDNQIESLKNSLEENVKNNINTIKISLNELDYRINGLTRKISQLPKTEFRLMGMERKFKLNDAIYTYLLQKRAEAQISRASNTPDYELIEPAKVINASISFPKKKINYLVAFLLGITFPLSFILIKDFTNNKIITRRDIQNITPYSILGNIFHSDRKSTKMLIDHPYNPTSESIRKLRANLQVMHHSKPKLNLLITSSTSNEGKSFVSVNLAIAHALIDKKTILLDFDLRKPKIHEKLNLQNEIGMSNYLSNRASLEEIIQKNIVENLDVITSGPIPPNPVELISHESTNLLINQLKEHYDFIIIDSPPLNAVADTNLLSWMVDYNLLVIRHNSTPKNAVSAAIETMEQQNFKDVGIVLNDIKVKDTNYEYGYHPKYYKGKKSAFAKLFSS